MSEHSADFFEEFYVEEDDELLVLNDDQVEASDDREDEISRSELVESPIAPPYSPLSSPERCRGQRSPLYGDRARSRSPVRNHFQFDPVPSSGVVLRIYNEDGDALDDTVNENIFIAPDAHPLYVISENMEIMLDNRVVGDRNSGICESAAVDDIDMVLDDTGVVKKKNDRYLRSRSVRTRLRGGRRGRVCGRGRRRPCRSNGGERHRRVRGTWEIGNPVEEIWLTDVDIPLELREMATDVVRKRQMRIQASANVNKSTHESNREVNEEANISEDENEYQDATDCTDNALLEGENPYFEWSSMETFQAKEETFKQKHTGSVKSYTTPYDAFRSYWDDDIVQQIVDETNQYASKIKSESFQRSWHPTNSHEVLCLFAFWMMLGIIKMPTINSCFSNNPLLKTDVFRKIFSGTRYSCLARALHFDNGNSTSDNAFNSNTGHSANYDRLHRLTPILLHLNAKFKANYILSRDICIDESLTLWKGRLDIKQYIRTKAAKFGIKTFELCESATGYLWSFIVYTGKFNTINVNPNDLKSTAVVRKLIAPLLNKGYRLFIHHWYNSPLLARFLKRNGTDCVGTLQGTRQDVPKIVTNAPLERGQFIARHSGDICVLSWQDKRRVNMISTCHGAAIGLPTVASNLPSRPIPFKPQVILDYNKYMGGVDLKDQMLEPYLLERKRCIKWYMKLFKRLLNCSILNARILLQSSLQRPVDHLFFRLQLVDSILTQHLSHCPLPRRAYNKNLRTPHPTRILHHKHWLIPMEPTSYEKSRNRKCRQRCVVCVANNRKDQKTPYKCEACDVPLCAVNCYKIYHTT